MKGGWRQPKMSSQPEESETPQPDRGGEHEEVGGASAAGPPDSMPPVPLPDNPIPLWPRVRRPVILFALTCASTFWVGINRWLPLTVPMDEFRQLLISNWYDGFIYMVAILGILFAHEMGHYLATVYYRVPASLPYFIPFPFSPFGTFGAVIALEGTHADRKQIFDIGIAGPLAGLVIAIPVTWIGISQINLTAPQQGPYLLDLPWAMHLYFRWFNYVGYHADIQLAFNQLNPWFMAGWLGLLVTGLNMLPVGQFDGGHVTYTLFGRTAHWIARVFLVALVAYGVYYTAFNLLLLTAMFLLVGPDHPPTRDDSVELGWGRTLLGYVCLTIPLFCLAPGLIVIVG